MTDKSDSRETEQNGDAERTSVIATSEAQPAKSQGNGHAPVDPDEIELNHVVPPPWQRVSSDAQVTQRTATPAVVPDPEPVTQENPIPVEQPTVVADDEETVNVERPVVTGTAAGRLFGDPVGETTVSSAPVVEQQVDGTARTAVNLGGSTPPGGVRGLGGSTPSALRRPGRGPRRANLQIKRFDPWSVLKLSLVLGVALFFVWLVAVGVLYAVLDGMGVWDKVNSTTTEFFQTGAEGGTAEPLISAGRVFGVAAVLGAVNIVLFSALATVGAFVYNVSADLAGGLEVTLAERE